MSKHQFKAESKRLLELMIGSIYTHREIFLRELISNASDACDKLALIALTDGTTGLSRDDFEISIATDEENRTLTISDNGVGMTEDELKNNLGVIAKSGTFAFREKFKDNENADENADAGHGLVGQFGVGFYSAFMVADKVTVISRAYGHEDAYKWESEGADGYTITPAERGAVGTDIILHIRPDTDDENYSEYLEEYTLRNLIRKYSDYIRFRVTMDVTKSRKVDGEDGKTKWEDYKEHETINSRVPLWQRPKAEITDELASEFFRQQWNAADDPAAVINISTEGIVSYRAMLFIPSKAPYDYFTRDYEPGLKLYASGVMVMERCPDLLPEHFRFVRGVVDSPDFTLNLSREVLQHDRQLKAIASNLARKVKSELESMLSDNREKYESFWAEFGLQLKYGIVTDYGLNRDNLKDLLLFWSAANKKYVTLKEYESSMLSDQPYAYYAAGLSRSALESLPQTGLVLSRGYDVLLLTDEIDDFVAQSLAKVGEKDLKSVRSDDLGLQSEEEKKAAEETEKSASKLLEFVKETLGDRVAAVKLSQNLASAASALTSQGAVTLEMERYFAQMKQIENAPKAERVLELNPEHAAYKSLSESFKKDKDKAKKIISALCGFAELAAGIEPPELAALADAVWTLAFGM